MSGVAPDDHGKRELLTGIDEQTDRLNRLVGEAAEMGQLDAGMFKLDLHPHSIQEALQPALEDAKASIENHPVEILVPPDLPMVRIDIARMREVLMHLLDNAGKYSAAGTPIKVTAEVKSDRLVISVADRGIGIDSLEQTLIFDKFYRGGRQRYTAPGAGMGLPIAKVDRGGSRRHHRRGQPARQWFGFFHQPPDLQQSDPCPPSTLRRGAPGRIESMMAPRANEARDRSP